MLFPCMCYIADAWNPIGSIVNSLVTCSRFYMNETFWLTFNSSRHLSYILSLVDHTISSDAGSEVDLTTPPRQDDLPRRRLRRLGTAAAEATLSPVPPDNQKGLDGYPDSMAPQTPTQVQEPEQQEATQKAKPTSTAAAVKAKAKASTAKATAAKTKAKKPSAQQETAGSTKTAPRKSNSSDASSTRKVVKDKKLKQKPAKKTARTGKVHKGNLKPKGKGATRNSSNKEPEHVDKSPAEQQRAKKQKHHNPGGPASGSGLKKSSPTAEPDQSATPAQPPDIAAALARASTSEVLEKEAKRKAYKARKQRFYNSLSSTILKIHCWEIRTKKTHSNSQLQPFSVVTCLTMGLICCASQVPEPQKCCAWKPRSPEDVGGPIGTAISYNRFIQFNFKPLISQLICQTLVSNFGCILFGII